MADYIDQNILCQAYIHIDPINLEETEYERFREVLEEYINTRAEFFLYDGVSTEIELKEGSLKVYASVFGFIYLAISQYGSFRSGVDYLEKDVKRLSEIVVSESLFQSKSRHMDTIRVEARIGLVGSLKDILMMVDQINRMRGIYSPDDISVKFIELEERIKKLILNLHNDTDKEYVKEELLKELKTIPRIPTPQKDKTLSEATKLLYREERKKLLNSCK